MPCPVSAVVAAAVLTLLLVGDAQLESTRRSNITLVDNGYEGILIAIGESVPESDSAKVLSQIEVSKLKKDILCYLMRVIRKML